MTGPPSPVFVYGTLAAPERAAALLDDWQFTAEAVLEGLHRVEGRYPTLAPGGVTAGRLLVTPELDVLDGYEGVAAGLYVRVAVPIAIDGGPRDSRRTSSNALGGCDSDRAWLYVGDPDRLDAPARWPGDGPFPARVTSHFESAGVTVRLDGPR